MVRLADADGVELRACKEGAVGGATSEVAVVGAERGGHRRDPSGSVRLRSTQREWRAAIDPLGRLWIPSSTATPPVRAACTSRDEAHAVSPWEEVVRRWRTTNTQTHNSRIYRHNEFENDWE